MTGWPPALGVMFGDGLPLLHAAEFHGSPWAWRAHPDVWLLMAVLGGGYVAAIRLLGPRYAPTGERPVTVWQAAAFGLGWLALWIVSDWPVHELAEGSLYSVHMTQHLLFSFVVPPLLLLGTPMWLARLLLRPGWLLRTVRVLTKPVVALLLFNMVMVLIHLPLGVEWMLRSEVVHLGSHAAVLGSAVLMWWPVLSPLPEIPRLSYPVAMAYLFLQSVVPTVPASFLTFSGSPIYEIYETMPRVGDISALTDQRAAGLIMKLGGGLILWGIIAVLFFRWYQAEEAQEPRPPKWDEVEYELERMGLTRR